MFYTVLQTFFFVGDYFVGPAAWCAVFLLVAQLFIQDEVIMLSMKWLRIGLLPFVGLFFLIGLYQLFSSEPQAALWISPSNPLFVANIIILICVFFLPLCLLIRRIVDHKIAFISLVVLMSMGRIFDHIVISFMQPYPGMNVVPKGWGYFLGEINWVTLAIGLILTAALIFFSKDRLSDRSGSSA